MLTWGGLGGIGRSGVFWLPHLGDMKARLSFGTLLLQVWPVRRPLEQFAGLAPLFQSERRVDPFHQVIRLQQGAGLAFPRAAPRFRLQV